MLLPIFSLSFTSPIPEVESQSFPPPPPDYSKGFGGRYGVEKDKVDKAAVGFDYKSQVEKHDSQKGELGKPVAAAVSGLGLGTIPVGAM